MEHIQLCLPPGAPQSKYTGHGQLVNSLIMVLFGMVMALMAFHYNRDQVFLQVSGPVTTPLPIRTLTSQSTANAPDIAQHSRRTAMLMPAGAAIASMLTVPAPTSAADGAFSKYDDGSISFEYPTSWQPTESTLPGRRKIVIFTTGRNENENINLVYTPVQGDFTKLGAFGSLERAGYFFTPQGAGLESKMLDERLWRSGDGYLYEYTQKTPDRFNHLRTLMVIIPGQYLVTLTTQSTQADWPEVEALFARTIKSFRFDAQ